MNERDQSRHPLFAWMNSSLCDLKIPVIRCFFFTPLPCVNASRSVIQPPLLFLQCHIPTFQGRRHHRRSCPRLVLRPLVLTPAMLSSFPVAWKLKGCTEPSAELREHFQWRVVAAGAALLSAQVQQLQAEGRPDGSEAKQSPSRLFGSSLIRRAVSSLLRNTPWKGEGKLQRRECFHVCFLFFLNPHALSWFFI